MIERHVTFHIHKGMIESFLQFFLEQYRPAMAASPGFISCTLLALEGGGQDVTMVIRFKDEETSVAWRGSLAHVELKPMLNSFYDKSDLAVYHVLA